MLPYLALGCTGITVSAVGLGTVKLGRNQGVKYPEPFSLPNDQQVATLLATAKEWGVNLLDTAPAYGFAEERLGKWLQGQRHDWVILTKAGETFIDGQSYFDFNPDAIRLSIERSLRRLKTDYLDIVLIHSNGDDQLLIDNKVFDELNKLKKSGLIRAFGMSTKTVAGGKRTVDGADVVMVTRNPLYTEEDEVIAYAKQQQKGVLIKKALASGHLSKFAVKDPVREALAFVYQLPGISSVIIGTLNPSHLQAAVAAVTQLLPSYYGKT